MNRLAPLAVGILVALPSTPVAAQDAAQLGTRIPPGTSVTLDRHGTCREITNKGPHPILVAANTPNEWSTGEGAFLNNLAAMDGVEAKPCAVPLPAVPPVVTAWDVDDDGRGSYFVDYLVKRNASGQPDATFDTAAYRGDGYGLQPSRPCTRTDGSDAFRVKPWGSYDYAEVSGLLWGDDDLVRFYAEASEGVTNPETGFCAITLKIYQDASQQDNRSITIHYIIGS